MLHVMSARCVARDLHTIVPGPLERTCWRPIVAPLNAIIIISSIIIIIIVVFHRFNDSANKIKLK